MATATVLIIIVAAAGIGEGVKTAAAHVLDPAVALAYQDPTATSPMELATMTMVKTVHGLSLLKTAIPLYPSHSRPSTQRVTLILLPSTVANQSAAPRQLS